MMSFLRRHKETLVLAVFIIFLVGIFVGLGGYYFTGADTTESVAVVGGAKIPYMRYRTRLSQTLDALRAQGTEVSDAMEGQLKQDLLREMIVDELLAQQAEKLGLEVSDAEVANTIQQTPAFQRDGRFDQQLYFQAVRAQFRVAPEQFEKMHRRLMLGAKLKNQMFRLTKVLPAEIREEYLRGGGALKDFDAKKDAFMRELQQQRTLDALNFYLRQLATSVEIRSFLEQRESGR
ncbi:MAG: SurA N-terminal domain-containing protein [Elusimicrobia bacterium]|nr:SurA N-terminal domain-containing protein [Elusimicrobiota bacterium]